MLMSAKGLSLASMAVMVALNPSNAIKISFAHFAFNITMALLSYLLPLHTQSLVSQRMLT